MAEPSRALVEAIGDGRVPATTTAEVIQEFVHVRSRHRGRADAVQLGRAFAELLSPLLVVEREALERGLRLFERLPALGAFDAVLAAAAIELEAAAFVSGRPCVRVGPAPPLPGSRLARASTARHRLAASHQFSALQSGLNGVAITPRSVRRGASSERGLVERDRRHAPRAGGRARWRTRARLSVSRIRPAWLEIVGYADGRTDVVRSPPQPKASCQRERQAHKAPRCRQRRSSRSAGSARRATGLEQRSARPRRRPLRSAART